jgi:hypothetical protein
MTSNHLPLADVASSVLNLFMLEAIQLVYVSSMVLLWSQLMPGVFDVPSSSKAGKSPVFFVQYCFDLKHILNLDFLFHLS